MSAAQTWFGRLDRQVAQQVGKDLVARRRLGRPRLRPECGDPHLAHQPLHSLAVDALAFRPQQRRHPPRAEERSGREQLIEPPHRKRSSSLTGRGRR
jgi:hypothetical protein